MWVWESGCQGSGLGSTIDEFSDLRSDLSTSALLTFGADAFFVMGSCTVRQRMFV